MQVTSLLNTPPASPLNMPAQMPGKAPDKTAEAAKQFEAVFLSEMMSHMFEGVKTDPEFGGGQGEDVFKSLLTNEYGKQLANAGGIGIADQLQKAMIQLQQHKG